MNTIKCYIEVKNNNHWHGLNVFGELSHLYVKFDRGENLLYKNSYKELPYNLSSSVKSVIDTDTHKVFWLSLLELMCIRNNIHNRLLYRTHIKNEDISPLNNLNILIGQITGVVDFFYNTAIDLSDIRMIFEII